MAKRKFTINFEVEAILELDDEVIIAVDDEWRSMFYDLQTPEDVAQMIGMNMILGDARLSRLDGWADQPDSNAKILDQDEYFIEVTEITNEK